MDTSYIQLLELVRSGLWGKKASVSCFTEGTDWKKVLSAASVQTVTGIVSDGMASLPEELLPDRKTLLKLHSLNAGNAAYHKLLNSTIGEICSKLEKENIDTVLLKGQGLALNYPDPEKRSCGDIDLYVGRKNYNRTTEVLENSGWLKGPHTESIQHLHFDRNGVPVEIHRIAGMMYGRKRHAAFLKWSESLLIAENCRKVSIGDHNVNLPPVRFDAVYIFCHLYRHLLSGGIGLRQICDLVMYLDRFSGSIDRNLLRKDLSVFGLREAWEIFGCIAVDTLGLEREKFPFYRNNGKNSRLSGMLLEEIILRNGNFGFGNPDRTARPDGYFRGKLHSFKKMMRHIRKMYRIFGSGILRYAYSYLLTGTKAVLNDMLSGNRKRKSA